MHPYLMEKLAEAHRDVLLRHAARTRLAGLARSERQRERLATRFLDALADWTRAPGIDRCSADA